MNPEDAICSDPAVLMSEIDRLKQVMNCCLTLARFTRDYPEIRDNAVLLADLLESTLTEWKPPSDMLHSEVLRLREAIVSIQQIVGQNIPPSERLALVAYVCQMNGKCLLKERDAVCSNG